MSAGVSCGESRVDMGCHQTQSTGVPTPSDCTGTLPGANNCISFPPPKVPWSTGCARCLTFTYAGLAAGPGIESPCERCTVEGTYHPTHCPGQPKHQITAQQDKATTCLFNVSPSLGSPGNQLPLGGVPLQQVSPHTSAPAIR